MSLVGPRWRRDGFGCWVWEVISWRRRLVAVVGEELAVGGEVGLGGVAVEEEWDLGIVDVRESC